MSDEPWGFADIYSVEADRSAGGRELSDVTSTDWRNILVLGRATATGVHPETLALVGRAKYMADELGCRVEVLLIGSELGAASAELNRYAIDTIYTVAAPDYAPIDHTAKILEQVVRKRRPELVLVFQSRSGDAITAYAANRLGVGFVTGAIKIDIDTMERRARIVHQASNEAFQIVSQMTGYPQFVSVMRGIFRAPMEDPYASAQTHALDVDVGPIADIKVVSSEAPPEAPLETAEKVVVVGARNASPDDVAAAQNLAKAIGASFGVTQGIVERGLLETDAIVGERNRRIAPRLLVTVGVRGSLDFLQAIRGDPVIAALGCDATDPIALRSDYFITGSVTEALASVQSALS